MSPIVLCHCNSPVGTFWIERDGRRFDLYLQGKGVLGSYDSIVTAADAVYTQDTGWDAFDRMGAVRVPTGVDKWKSGPPRR